MLEGRPDHIQSHEIVEILPYLDRSVSLQEKDALALLNDARGKFPSLEEELNKRAGELVTEIEVELEMTSHETVVIGEDIIRGIVHRSVIAAAAQVLHATGTTLRNIKELNDKFESPESSSST